MSAPSGAEAWSLACDANGSQVVEAAGEVRLFSPGHALQEHGSWTLLSLNSLHHQVSSLLCCVPRCAALPQAPLAAGSWTWTEPSRTVSQKNTFLLQPDHFRCSVTVTQQQEADYHTNQLSSHIIFLLQIIHDSELGNVCFFEFHILLLTLLYNPGGFRCRYR